MTAIQMVLSFVWMASFGLMIYGTCLILVRRKKPHAITAETAESTSLSILKPLKGVDADLESNLRSFFLLQGPRYELIFSLADADDPARPIVESLLREFPEVDAKLVTGAVPVGPNPKVNNLIKSSFEAKHDLLLISDSNVRAKPDYLLQLLPFTQDPQIGLVTALVAGVSPRGVGGRLESLFLNTFCARGMILAFWAKKPVVVGKSMLFRRSVASRFGGLKVLGRFLAEDYVAGQAMEQLGLKVVLMHDTVEQHLGDYSLAQFWSRHVRWGRLRRMQAPLFFPLELFHNALVVSGLGTLVLANVTKADAFPLFLLQLFFWFLCDMALMVKMSRLSLQAMLLWGAREFIAIVLFWQIYLRSTVQWRGQRLRLRPGGVLE